MKDTKKKLRWTLVPADVLNQIVRVFDYGANKYAPHDWKLQNNGEIIYLDAAFRHINAHCQGRFRDKDSGLPHLSHAIASLMMALWHCSISRRAKRKTVSCNGSSAYSSARL